MASYVSDSLTLTLLIVSIVNSFETMSFITSQIASKIAKTKLKKSLCYMQ